MRGKVTALDRKDHAFRITPAYAGKSALNWAQMSTDEDHPRLCGEKLFQRHRIFQGTGSPPPMRGKACSSHNA